MRLASVAPLAVLSLTFLACGDGHRHMGDMHGDDGSSSCTEIGCADGVSLELAGVASKYATSLPLAVHVCVDATCIDYQLARGTDGTVACNRAPAAAYTSTTTTCSLRSDGVLDVEFVDTAGAFASGSHVLAVSLKSAGGIVYEHAEMLTMKTSQPNGPGCEPTCYRAEVSLTP